MSNDIEHQLDQSAPRVPVAEKDHLRVHPRQKEANEFFANLAAIRRREAGADTAMIAKGLTRTLAPRAQFPEALFVQWFIPLWAGEIEPSEMMNTYTWINKVAGDERTPVDIVDEQGEVLFTVPPLLDTSILEKIKPGGLTMSMIERQYERTKEIDAMGSQHFLTSRLEMMHIKEKPSQEVFDNTRVWDMIFIRYGRGDKIIKIVNLENDPNKEAAGVALKAKPGAADNSDTADYELDCD